MRTSANTDSETEAELIVLRKLNAIMAQVQHGDGIGVSPFDNFSQQVKEKELFDFLDKDGNGCVFLRARIHHWSSRHYVPHLKVLVCRLLWFNSRSPQAAGCVGVPEGLRALRVRQG